MALRLWSVVVCTAVSHVAGVAVDERAAANPIRKVVTLLQAMQKKVSTEGEKAEDLHDKFMCYCKTSGGDLSASISVAETKIPNLQSSIESSQGKKTQFESDLKQHQVDRSAAKAAMQEATALRRKEKAVYDKDLADNRANLAALKKAVTAISDGMSGGFLQTGNADVVRAFVTSKQDMLNSDRQEVLAFLSGTQNSEYAPSSGEIEGILKQMADEMAKTQEELISVEAGSVKDYGGLIAAKKKEVAALSKSIEEKLNRVASLGIEIATMKNDLTDTEESLAGDNKFAADLKKNCAEREGIHAAEKQTRAEEIVALADTIKILNDDDALELFKSTLPSASASFVQTRESSSSMRDQAAKLLFAVKARQTSGQTSHHLDFILLALHGKKIGFEKVVTLIDNLVATLKTEQQDDEHKKEYCEGQFDETDDRKKGLVRSLSDTETVIEEAKEGIATLSEEIKALMAGIAALDKAVAEATEQRKAESAEFKDLMASDTAAKELLLFAKNRLQKFYNPRLYKAAPKRELSDGDRIYENGGGFIPTEAPGGIANTGIGFVQLSSHIAPPPAVAAAYKKKSQENNGVMAMIDLLAKDLDTEMTEAQTEEKNAQQEYGEMTSDSAEKRRQDSKTLVDKEAAKADMSSALEKSEDNKKSTGKELMGTMKYIQSLHAECDWLIQYFDVRQAARADEVDSLEKAKAVLSGADYSLAQENTARSRKFLRHA